MKLSMSLSLSTMARRGVALAYPYLSSKAILWTDQNGGGDYDTNRLIPTETNTSGIRDFIILTE